MKDKRLKHISYFSAGRGPAMLLLLIISMILLAGDANSIVNPKDLVKIEPAFVEASSVLKASLSKDKKQFAAEKAIDGKWETAWAEGAEGPGLGEWIRLVLAKPQVVDYVAIIPGWAKNKVRFYNNPRLRSAIVSYSTGQVQEIYFEDLMAFQFLELRHKKPVTWVQITVAEVYPGKKFEDLSLSEVEIYAGKSN